jgi:hypothetical protein
MTISFPGTKRRSGERPLLVEGELLLLQGTLGAADAAESHFRQALDWARRQGVLSWELRAVTKSCPTVARSGALDRCNGTPAAGL